MTPQQVLPWLEPGESFPPVEQTWGPHDAVDGLLAAGGALDVSTLVTAYSQGVFPWFSSGQPVLWWCPNPRMVLHVNNFRLHPSLRKTLRAGLKAQRLELRMDTAFRKVIRACATTPRQGQHGTWIVPEMIEAYCALHHAGHAHSVETWWDGELVGGLYCVNLGRMVFGESMFSHRTDASKMALAGLMAFCHAHQIEAVDCQQNTSHLASLGAREQSREEFLALVARNATHTAPDWRFDPIYWNALLKPTQAT